MNHLQRSPEHFSMPSAHVQSPINFNGVQLVRADKITVRKGTVPKTSSFLKDVPYNAFNIWSP